LKTYLVTGAGGFVGSHLTERLLNRGDRVVALVRDGRATPDLGRDVIHGSVDDVSVVRRALARYDLDGVFHLAAHAKVEECRRDPLGAFESNVRGTYTLLDALSRGEPIPTVVATTDHVYGERGSDGLPAREDSPFRGGGSAYDVSKAAADIIAQSYSTRIVRCANIYGRGDRDLSRIVPSMVTDVLEGRQIRIRSDGSPIREYLHIEDAVDGYLAVMDHGRDHRAYNLGSTMDLSVMNVAVLVMDAANALGLLAYERPPIILGTRTGDISRITLNSQRAKEELGWTPKVEILDGLKDTIAWWYAERKGLT
jgi:CDP-glucose 4,6-dehydratase